MPSSVSRASISSAFLLVIAIGGILFTRPDDVAFHLTGESSATRLRYRRIPGVSRPASFPSEPRSVRDRTLRRRAEAPPSSDEHRAAGRYCGACGGRALLRFRTLPRNVRILWIVAVFIALNVSVPV